MEIWEPLHQLGFPGDTWQPAGGHLHFHSQGLEGLLSRCSLQIFKFLDSRAFPGALLVLLFHMVTAANFTFLNYEEGILEL